MEQPLCDTAITGHQIELWLKEYFQRPLQIKGCHPEKIGAGQGFTSTILRIGLEYAKDMDTDVDLPKTIILKTPNIAAVEEMMKKMPVEMPDDNGENIEFMTAFHTYECAAYRTLSMDKPVPLPVVYAATECKGANMGAIVMEDMGDKSTVLGDAVDTLSKEQLEAVADAVADLHAWCFRTDVNLDERFETADSDRRKAQFGQWMGMMQACFMKVNEVYPNVFNKIDASVIGKMMDFDGLTRMCEKHRAILPDILVHGDFYANNIMFEKIYDASNTSTFKIGSKIVALVDWQICHLGPAMEDFARLLTVSVDPDTRRKHGLQILRRYYDRLVQVAGKDKVKASFDELLGMYNDHFVMAGTFFVLMLTWLQNLFVQASGEEGDRQKKLLFERCYAVYEDMIPLMEKQHGL